MGLFYLFIFHFVMFGCHILDACSFLIRNRKGINMHGRKRGYLGGGEGGEIVLILYWIRKYFFQLKRDFFKVKV